MQIPWLICQLAVVAAIPLLPSSSPIRTRRTANAINDTEADPGHNNHESQKQEICETEHCHKIAKRIQQSIDTTANPCENFYQYACGSWGKNNPIPEDYTMWSEYYVINNKTYGRMKELLEEPISSTDIPPVRMVKEFYRSCMDLDAIEKRGIKPIQEILNRTGGWPMAMPASEWHEIPWQTINKEHMSLIESYSAFFDIGVTLDPNAKRYVLAIDQNIKHLTAREKDPIEAYKDDIKYVANMSARQNGYTLDESQLTYDVEEMVHFELLLTKIIKTGKVKDVISGDSETMTIEELQKYYDNSNITAPTAKVDFLEVIQNVYNLANVRINSSEPIIVYNPNFLHQVANLLENTTQRTLVNYVQWNMMNTLFPYSTQKMRDIKFGKSGNLTNSNPRWKTCVQELPMQNAISYMFVKRYTSDYVVDEVMKLVKNMQEELGNRIKQTHWLSSTIKENLLQKIDDIGREIGYPEWYRNDDEVIRRYNGLSIGSDYLQNVLNDYRKKLQEPQSKQVPKKNHWLDYPTVFNAYYNPVTNTIFILAAMIQDPYFTPSLPDVVNYGGVGFTIGHELSHSCDNKGIAFDKDGHKITWESNNWTTEYDKRVKCFANQYTNYYRHLGNDTNIMVSDNQKDGENIADSLGLQIAYAAYKKVAKKKIQSKLPGFENISNDKMFFLSFANAWCTAKKVGYKEDLDDEHSSSEYRITATVSNMPAFFEAFNCPQNNSTNQPKCTLWD